MNRNVRELYELILRIQERQEKHLSKADELRVYVKVRNTDFFPSQSATPPTACAQGSQVHSHVPPQNPEACSVPDIDRVAPTPVTQLVTSDRWT